MKKLGEVLSQTRAKKRLSLKKVSKELLIKEEHLKALEEEDYLKFEDLTFAKAYIKSYSNYLGLDSDYTFALFRREFDETKFPKIQKTKGTKRLFFTPPRIINFLGLLALAAFVIYIAVLYSGILSAPKLEIYTPQNNASTAVKVITITGTVEKDSTLVINGKFIAVDTDGNFSSQYSLEEGENTIEFIVSKRLSPKTKVTKTVRLVS